MKKYVSTDYTGCDCFTAGKLYELQGECRVIDDDGYEQWVWLDGCPHLDGNPWTIHEVGTLAELDVKAGDVVEYTAIGEKYFTPEVFTFQCWDGGVPYSDKHLVGGGSTLRTDDAALFRIISRAQPKPTPFGKMTDEEQAALLLAHHRGEAIETMGLATTTPYDVSHQWMKWTPTIFRDDCAYRIALAEPKRETVNMDGFTHNNEWFFRERDARVTHRITFDTIDGVPDCASVKMEAV